MPKEISASTRTFEKKKKKKMLPAQGALGHYLNNNATKHSNQDFGLIVTFYT